MGSLRLKAQNILIALNIHYECCKQVVEDQNCTTKVVGRNRFSPSPLHAISSRQVQAAC